MTSADSGSNPALSVFFSFRAKAGCACNREMMAVVCNYFSRLSYLAGNHPAIICMGLTVVLSVLRVVAVG